MRDQLRRHKGRSRRRRSRPVSFLLLLAGLVAVGWGLAGLTRYGADLAASRSTARELREIYNGADLETGEEGLTTVTPDLPEETWETGEEVLTTVTPELPEETQETGGLARESAAAEMPGAKAAAPAMLLPEEVYPDNPKRQISSRFRELRKEGRDIVGWLTLGRLLDEPVVQRDHIYYMDHDARENANVNGALFLDAGIRLDTRPYIYIIFGHNMKSGAMFGCLRNYENIAYYRRDPFMTFDTMYEEGRYAVFAVGTVSMEEEDGNYVDFFGLKSADVRERERAIQALISASVHTCPLDVRPEDQLLVLVTCVGTDEERRVVAARRIRADETEEDIRKLVEKSR